jgi:hypothetical chaperone protein
VSRAIGCAIDFGTSNSSVALVYEDDVQIVNLQEPSNPTAVRSLLYLHRDGNRDVGANAIRQYSVTATHKTDDEHDARLLSGLKYLVATRDAVTSSWGKRFHIDELVAEILRWLKSAAEDAGGGRLDRVLLGHPIRFASGGGGAGDQKQGLATLASAAQLAGFRVVDFLSEPEGALATVATTTSTRSSALTVDFGGGTCDIALSRPDGGDVYTEGLQIGGDHFDAHLFALKLENTFGWNQRFARADGTELPIPARWRIFPRRFHRALQLIRDRRAAVELRQWTNQLKGYELPMLYTILFDGHVVDFYRAIERAKIELSQHEHTILEFSRREKDVYVSEDVARAELEEAIYSDLERVTQAVHRVLDRAGMGPEDVDIVLPTGGSSTIPAFRGRLEQLFGYERIADAPYLSTVVEGLGRAAQSRWIG